MAHIAPVPELISVFQTVVAGQYNIYDRADYDPFGMWNGIAKVI
jgi:hypothetical protein